MTDSVAARVLTALSERRQTLATAESLTGGMIGSLLTAVPGASAVYRGGLITYATDLKSALAGVEERTLAQRGPVAAATAQEMAVGVADRCAADWGISVTGVAGPERQDGHPVGQVFVGLVERPSGFVRVEELSLSGSRSEIRLAAAEEALALLERALGMPLPVTDVK